MRTYQTRKEKILPKDVYNNTLWYIRGYERRKKKLKDKLDESPDPRQPHVKGGEKGSPVETKSEKREPDKAINDAIDKALKTIPEEYRRGVWQKVVYDVPYPDDAAKKTYSSYKSDFVVRTARYLGLI